MTDVGLTRDQYWRYFWNGDGPLVGVTSILKLQDILVPGDLAAWGGGIVFEFMQHPELFDTRKEFPLRQQAMAAVSAKKDIGSEVHAQVERILLNETAIPTERTAPYVYAFSSFLAKERPEFLGVEQRVANLKYRFAGTFDMAARLRGHVALIDVKTGRHKTSHLLQLAGYAAAEFIGEEGNPVQKPLPPFTRFFVLYLTPEGYELEEQNVTPEDRRHFLALARGYQSIRAWDDQHKNGVKP